MPGLPLASMTLMTELSLKTALRSCGGGGEMAEVEGGGDGSESWTVTISAEWGAN